MNSCLCGQHATGSIPVPPRSGYKIPSQRCLPLRCLSSNPNSNATTGSVTEAGREQVPPPSRTLRIREIRTGGSIRIGHPKGSGGRDTQHDIKQRLGELFLPDGYPSSVSIDYLDYQLWSVPCHITGWLSHSLTTSSLLQAVGISAGPVGTTLTAAAIKWIIKDGIGAAGKFIVGGKLGLEFDDDPRRWRMYAELMTTVGLALEVATLVYPPYFLVLASTGNFAKAVGKGMGKPVFRRVKEALSGRSQTRNCSSYPAGPRVIQTHFAVSDNVGVIQTHFAVANNVGSVAAKEEIWEVAGQLTGYAASVLVLQALESSGSSLYTLVGLWAAIQGVHVALRYKALKQLSFATLNQKRACMLTSAHTSGQPLPGVAELNRVEPIWTPASAMDPVVKLGCSLKQAFGDSFEGHAGVISLVLQQPDNSSRSELGVGTALFNAPSTNDSSSELGDGTGSFNAPSTNGLSSELGGGTGLSNAPSTSGRSAEELGPVSEAGPCHAWTRELELYFRLYEQEQYILVWRDSKAYVVLKEEAEPEDILRSVWQAAWLNGHAKERLHMMGPSYADLTLSTHDVCAPHPSAPYVPSATDDMAVAVVWAARQRVLQQ
eukprot:gene20131-26862_t